MLKRVTIVYDILSNLYLIPIELEKEFRNDVDYEYEMDDGANDNEVFVKFCEKWEKFRQKDGLHLLELYAEI